VRVTTLPALVCFLGPFLSSLHCLTNDAFFRSDAAILRRFGSAPVVVGSPSVALSLPFELLPLGDVVLRAALVSALAAGVSGLVLFLWSLRLLQDEGHSGYDVWLAMGASVAACLGFPFLAAGAMLGSGALGASLGLVLLYLRSPQSQPTTGYRRVTDRWLVGLRGLALPALSAALFLESPALFLALWAAEFARSLRGRAPGPSRVAQREWMQNGLASAGAWLRRSRDFVGFVAVGGLFLVLQGPRFLHLDASLLADRALWEGTGPAEHHPFAWIGEMGFVWFPAAIVGLGQALLHSPGKLLPLSVVLLADALLPSAPELGWLTASPASSRAALHLVALGVWATFSASGLRTLAVALEAMQLKGARLSGAFLATLGLASALAGAEDAARLIERTPRRGVQLYSERLLLDLPPKALVLGRTGLTVERLLAAQALGERRDVLVVPEPALGLAAHLERFLTLEPGLSKLILDLNLAGIPSEHALYELTDRRPVLVEVNPAWDVRLLAHLEPRAGLAAYSPHSLTNSERRARLDLEEPVFGRLLAAASEGIEPDRTTEKLVRDQAASLAEGLGRVGDSASRERLSTFVEPPEGPLPKLSEEGQSPRSEESRPGTRDGRVASSG
jgi:hypothetical protein